MFKIGYLIACNNHGVWHGKIRLNIIISFFLLFLFLSSFCNSTHWREDGWSFKKNNTTKEEHWQSQEIKWHDITILQPDRNDRDYRKFQHSAQKRILRPDFRLLANDRRFLCYEIHSQVGHQMLNVFYLTNISINHFTTFRHSLAKSSCFLNDWFSVALQFLNPCSFTWLLSLRWMSLWQVLYLWQHLDYQIGSFCDIYQITNLYIYKRNLHHEIEKKEKALLIWKEPLWNQAAQ